MYNRIRYNRNKEFMRKILLTEKQVITLFGLDEGVDYTVDNNKNIGFSINSKQDDKSNKGVDTRVFGTKKEIRNGDGTLGGNNNTLSDTVMAANRRINLYINCIEWIKNGCEGKIRNATQEEINYILKKFDSFKNETENINDATNEMLFWLNKSMERDQLIAGMYQDKYDRSENSNKKDLNTKIGRYNLSKVPGTNIDVIALFEMNDFNFSDAIKNGKLRQNGLTDKLLGIDKKDREKELVAKGQSALKKLPITYDDNIDPDIANNFSLTSNNISNPDHFKKQYGYQDSNYTSITKFIDKSILTARYALNEIGYKPHVIVGAPSSSKFNHYYCINLSRKLGIEYIPDFFKRNVINLTYDEQTENDLNKAGATFEEKEKIRHILLNAVFAEIMAQAKVPINNFVSENFDILSNIAIKSHAREKVDMNLLTSILTLDVCTELVNQCVSGNKDLSYKIIAKRYIQGNLYKNFKDASEANNRNFIRSEIVKAIKLHIGIKTYQSLLFEVDRIIQEYSNKLSQGMTYNFNKSKFKITEIEKRFRPSIHNVYLIADEYLNKQKDKLQTKYRNANFLVFDEDINSGATLKLVCEVLMDKMDNTEKNIKCLVNAVSLGGR